MSHSETEATDLVDRLEDGRLRLRPGVHPMPDLLDLDAEQVLDRFRRSQQGDFEQAIAGLDDPDNDLYRLFAGLREAGGADNPFARTALFREGALHRLFMDLHEHVMGHPVWRHPFFVRVFEGRFTREQLAAFALQYFNQVKNTRQCVALAQGRFSGLMPMPYGVLNERLSELTQVVLAQLIADEYGVGTHEVEDYPSLAGLFDSTTHIVMYRQLFEGLGIPFTGQDVPMLPAVADNVLTQRLVAGDPAFSPLEGLASVGLGMEWGVPEFFSLLLGGMARFAVDQNVPLTRRHLWVFIAHVQYDVLHAIAVMMVTSLWMRDDSDVVRVKGATNTLMAARYDMMSGLYRHVFDEDCAGFAGIEPAVRYRLDDRRIEAALRQARAGVAAERVVDGAAYRQRRETPFVFADGV